MQLEDSQVCGTPRFKGLLLAGVVQLGATGVEAHCSGYGMHQCLLQPVMRSVCWCVCVAVCADVDLCLLTATCRGNLGLDCLPEKMALVQKNLIQSCNLVSA